MWVDWQKQMTASKRRRFLLKTVPPAAFSVAFGLICVSLILGSRAQTPTADMEPENGSISAPATSVADAEASGGNAIQFGPRQFIHPGVFLDATQLDFVKDKLTANQAPWTTGYGRIYSWAKNLAYVPYPTADITLNCSTMDCTATIMNDSLAAYAQAMMYYFGLDANKQTYGKNSVRIMNAWAQYLKGSTGSQAKLQLAWSAEIMARAAEIIRYSYTPAQGDPALDVAGLSTMFTNVYVPALSGTAPEATSSNGNWDLSMADGLMNIAVFTEDWDLFDSAVARWRARVPAYIYLASDGATPVAPPGGLYNTPEKLRCFWLGSGTPTTSCTVPAGFSYVEGMSQETCRDLGHTVMGTSAMAYAAETARIQGVDLYGEQQQRITLGLEFSAQYGAQLLDTGTVPSWLCGGTMNVGGTDYRFGWEVAYNAYAGRLGLSLPYTGAMVTRNRATGATNHTAWETLTHAFN